MCTLSPIYGNRNVQKLAVLFQVGGIFNRNTFADVNHVGNKSSCVLLCVWQINPGTCSACVTESSEWKFLGVVERDRAPVIVTLI